MMTVPFGTPELPTINASTPPQGGAFLLNENEQCSVWGIKLQTYYTK